MTEKNGKSKLIWWLAAIVVGILTWIFSFVLSTQAKTDIRQDNEFKELRTIVETNNVQIGKILEIMNRVDVIQMNATLQSIEGRTSRMERKLDL